MRDSNLTKVLGVVGFVLFVNTIIAWRSSIDMSESKMTLEAEVSSLQRKRDELIMKNADLERQIHRMDLKLEHVETQVRDYATARRDRKHLPTIFFVTPTKKRPEQKADLTRLGQTLARVPNLFWIIVEDADQASEMLDALLKRLDMPHSAHLVARTPAKWRMNASDPNWKLPRGVEQRNAALSYLRTNFHGSQRAVLYFGDDDNTYDWRLFDEMRRIDRVGVWPVGIVGGQLVEGPIVDDRGHVSGFTASWKPERPFPIDMAAFAVNWTLVQARPDVGFSYAVARGYQESHFLEGLGVTRADLEPLADFGSKVLVWHTRTEASKLSPAVRHRLATPEDLTAIERDAVF